jgi:hypothetical protein
MTLLGALQKPQSLIAVQEYRELNVTGYIAIYKAFLSAFNHQTGAGI